MHNHVFVYNGKEMKMCLFSSWKEDTDYIYFTSKILALSYKLYIQFLSKELYKNEQISMDTHVWLRKMSEKWKPWNQN